MYIFFAESAQFVIRGCNALIVQAKVHCQWDHIGHIPRETVKKFTPTIRQNELQI